MNERHLAPVSPALDPFFACDRGLNIAGDFILDEARHVIALGKSRDELLLVLRDSTDQVIGHAGVKHSGFVRHDIDVVVAHGCDSSVRARRTERSFATVNRPHSGPDDPPMERGGLVSGGLRMT